MNLQFLRIWMNSQEEITSLLESALSSASSQIDILADGIELNKIVGNDYPDESEITTEDCETLNSLKQLLEEVLKSEVVDAGHESLSFYVDVPLDNISLTPHLLFMVANSALESFAGETEPHPNEREPKQIAEFYATNDEWKAWEKYRDELLDCEKNAVGDTAEGKSVEVIEDRLYFEMSPELLTEFYGQA